MTPQIPFILYILHTIRTSEKFWAKELLMRWTRRSNSRLYKALMRLWSAWRNCDVVLGTSTWSAIVWGEEGQRVKNVKMIPMKWIPYQTACQVPVRIPFQSSCVCSSSLATVSESNVNRIKKNPSCLWIRTRSLYWFVLKSSALQRRLSELSQHLPNSPGLVHGLAASMLHPNLAAPQGTTQQVSFHAQHLWSLPHGDPTLDRPNLKHIIYTVCIYNNHMIIFDFEAQENAPLAGFLHVQKRVLALSKVSSFSCTVAASSPAPFSILTWIGLYSCGSSVVPSSLRQQRLYCFVCGWAILKYDTYWYVLSRARGCGVIADPLDRVTAGLHLFLHSTGPPDEPDQPTPDAQALGLRPNARAKERRHLHLFIIRTDLQAQMMPSLKDSIEHMHSGPFKLSFIYSISPGHVTNWILPGKWNQSPHLQSPRWTRLCRDAGRAWHLDPATQTFWFGLLGCPCVAKSKWVQVISLLYFIWMKFCRKSLY